MALAYSYEEIVTTIRKVEQREKKNKEAYYLIKMRTQLTQDKEKSAVATVRNRTALVFNEGLMMKLDGMIGDGDIKKEAVITLRVRRGSEYPPIVQKICSESDQLWAADDQEERSTLGPLAPHGSSGANSCNKVLYEFSE